MSRLQGLLTLVRSRNSREEYTKMTFRVLRSLSHRFRTRTMEDGISGNVVIEAVLQGYLESHPAVLAMIDQWIRDHLDEPPEKRAPRLTKHDLEEIYAAARGGMVLDEEDKE